MKPLFFALSAALCLACTPQGQSEAAPSPPARQQGAAMHIDINGKRFTLQPADTAAAAELRKLLPLSLNMADHLQNEKHAELPRRLPAADSRPGRIRAGDVMLWQGNTIVVFYESFDSSYRYTRLGSIANPAGLKEAVGKGSVNIRFTAD
ncbi:cyclophilin-like fold protein [Neisseria sp.]|uniref:cyclophilin-like fold protein n=1 Tax=Neisseria sp. TaxID=192066 RepID=UPI0035A045FF